MDYSQLPEPIRFQTSSCARPVIKTKIMERLRDFTKPKNLLATTTNRGRLKVRKGNILLFIWKLEFKRIIIISPQHSSCTNMLPILSISFQQSLFSYYTCWCLIYGGKNVLFIGQKYSNRCCVDLYLKIPFKVICKCVCDLTVLLLRDSM